MATLPVVVTEQDMRRIKRMLSVSGVSVLTDLVAELARKLEGAIQVRSDLIRGDVVTLDSELTIENLETGETEDVVLVLPDEADAAGPRSLSVLAPLGWQVLGRREGDVVRFRTPGSGQCSARIRKIHHQPEAARRVGSSQNRFDWS